MQNGAGEDASLREELLAGMTSEIQGLQRVVDDLARLRDQLVGRLQLQRRPVSLGEWLSHAVSPWRESAREKGLRWEVNAPPDLPLLDMDPDRVGQALGNLLSNAVKYTPTGGTISVSAGTADGAAWIRVSDTGPGITFEEQAHLFTPFYRGKQARGPQSGMGLGLSITRDLIAAHNGRLEVESVPGVGSYFTLWLPSNDMAADSDKEETLSSFTHSHVGDRIDGF
jgi:two-component system sensor histidine kinase BaeS